MSAHYTGRFSREELVNRLIKIEQEYYDLRSTQEAMVCVHPELDGPCSGCAPVGTEPMPSWYVILGDVVADEGFPDAVRESCQEALAYVDRLRKDFVDMRLAGNRLNDAMNEIVGEGEASPATRELDQAQDGWEAAITSQRRSREFTCGGCGRALPCRHCGSGPATGWRRRLAEVALRGGDWTADHADIVAAIEHINELEKR